MGRAGESARIRWFVAAVSALDPSPGWQALTAQLARLNARPDLAIRTAKQILQEQGAYVGGGYPVVVPPRLPKRVTYAKPENSLVLAVIRQESAFDAKATSHAGARGLMQLMPATAKVVAKRARVRYVKARLTRNPDYNMALGQSYLAELLKDFKGSLPMAIAGYNAGPHRVRQWVKAFGDPRDADVDAIDWIEMIPFDETRNYVQRVLENLQVYRSRLADTEVALRLEDDLHK